MLKAFSSNGRHNTQKALYGPKYMKTHEDNDIKIDATGNTYRQSFVDHLTEARDGEWTTQTGEEAILESKAEFEMLFNTKIIDNH